MRVEVSDCFLAPVPILISFANLVCGLDLL